MKSAYIRKIVALKFQWVSNPSNFQTAKNLISSSCFHIHLVPLISECVEAEQRTSWFLQNNSPTGFDFLRTVTPIVKDRDKRCFQSWNSVSFVRRFFFPVKKRRNYAK